MKRFISLFLSLSISCTFLFSMSAFALESAEESFETTRDLITVVEEIQEYKTQTYSFNDTSNIDVLVNNDEYQIVEFREGSKIDIVTYNVTTGQIYVDGNEITVIDMPNPNEGIEPTTLMSSFDHQYKNVQLSQKIINYTTAALSTIIGVMLATPTPIAMYIASEYINNAMSSGYGHSDACYAFMFKCMDDSYLFYVKYWSMYWDPGYYYHLKTYSQTIYQ